MARNKANTGGAGLLAKRRLGKTGEELSKIGFGGIIVKDTTKEQAAGYVREAIERGVNYFDVAPTYGNAEDMLGPALEPYRRDGFLACKTTERSQAGAWQELQTSLEKMRTDYFDLYQLHAVNTAADVQEVLGPRGALEAVLRAQEEGLVRYIGFSSHSESAALQLMDAFDFDTILFPINWALYLNGDFGPAVLQRAQEKNIGRLCLKALAKSALPQGESTPYPNCWYIPIDDGHLADLALRFTLSQPVTAAIPPGDIRLFRLALDIAENFTPITEGEVSELAEKGKGVDLIFHK